MSTRVAGRINSNPPGYLTVGAPGGVAGLDGDGKVPVDQVPDVPGSDPTALHEANNLSDVADPATARTNLGLGTAATHATGDFAQTANNLSDVANAATALANLGGAPQSVAQLLPNSGGGARYLGDTFLRGDRALVGDTAPSGHKYSQYGVFNSQNFAPKIVGRKFVIDPAAANWAGWSFILCPHTSAYTALAAEFTFTASVLGSPTSTEEGVLVAFGSSQSLARRSVQAYITPLGWGLVKLFDGNRVPPGAVGYLTVALNPGGGPITSLSVASGAYGGGLGLTQAIPAGTVTVASNDGAHTQTFTTAGAAAGATTVPVSSATPNFAYSATPPRAVVCLPGQPATTGTWSTALAEDSVRRYRAAMFLDAATSTVTVVVSGPTGVLLTQSWTDADFAAIWGLMAGVQLLRGTTSGDVACTAVSTSGVVQSVSVPPTPASTPYFSGDATTFIGCPAPSWPAGTAGGLWAAALVTPDLWQTGTRQTLLSQWKTNDFSFWFGLYSSAKKLEMGVSVDGVATGDAVSSTTHTLTDAATAVVGALYDPATGNITFYTSTATADLSKKPDNSDGGTWAQLGTAVSSGVTGALWQSGEVLRIGNRNTASTQPYTGYVNAVRLMDSPSGTVMADRDYRTAAGQVDAESNVWTPSGTGLTFRVPESSVVGLTTDLAAINATLATLAAVPTYVSLDTTTRSATNDTADTVLNTFTTVAAGALAVGQVYELTVDGDFDCQATSGTFTLKIKIGTTVMTVSLLAGVSQTSGATNKAWTARFSFYIEATGSGGVVSCLGRGDVITAAAGTTGVAVKQDVAHSVNLSSGLALTTVASMGTASASNIMRIYRARFKQIK